jgi:hypothetical protein
MNPATYTIANKEASNKYTPIVVGVLVVGGALATYFFVIKPILEGLGIKDTKYDARFRYLKGFDPNYYKSNLSKVTISTEKARSIALKIYQSYGILNDDEELLYGAISEAGSEYNLSKVSDIFMKETGKSMAEYIGSFANNADTEFIYKTINSW